ncbi:Cyclin-D1-binding protein 1 [Desmophyllum pertusum]|uniref:Cyclin-D1-binding protein 1 n=1 Tax=Desmophyllum pertusum TaxID=174260 RepID=A0A9W9ZKD8_9CNID|nr:Cyclin-D1-binding protein 1 [Desmophyllum pertusum]
MADEVLRSSPRRPKLTHQLKEMLNKARNYHFTLESDSAWLDFLNKAIDHNMDKLTGLLEEQGTNT